MFSNYQATYLTEHSMSAVPDENFWGGLCDPSQASLSLYYCIWLIPLFHSRMLILSDHAQSLIIEHAVPDRHIDHTDLHVNELSDLLIHYLQAYLICVGVRGWGWGCWFLFSGGGGVGFGVVDASKASILHLPLFNPCMLVLSDHAHNIEHAVSDCNVAKVYRSTSNGESQNVRFRLGPGWIQGFQRVFFLNVWFIKLSVTPLSRYSHLQLAALLRVRKYSHTNVWCRYSISGTGTGTLATALHK